MCELFNAYVSRKTGIQRVPLRNTKEFMLSFDYMDSFIKNDFKPISHPLDQPVKGVHNEKDIKRLKFKNIQSAAMKDEKEFTEDKTVETVKINSEDVLSGDCKEKNLCVVETNMKNNLLRLNAYQEPLKSIENIDNSLAPLLSPPNKTKNSDVQSEKISVTSCEYDSQWTQKNEFAKNEDPLIRNNHDLFESTIKWLETAHLEKFNRFFGSLTYDDMINLDDSILEKKEITKGARQRILIAVSKLRERLSLLKEVKSNIDDGGSLVLALKNLKNILNGPICSKDKDNLPEKLIEVMNSIGEKLLKNCHSNAELYLFMKLTINIFQLNAFQISHKRTLFYLCNELMNCYQSNIPIVDWDPAVQQLMGRILAEKSVRNVDIKGNDQQTNRWKSFKEHATDYKGANIHNAFEIARDQNEWKSNSSKTIADYQKCVKSVQKCFITKPTTVANDAKFSKNENLIAEASALNIPKIHVYNKYQKETKKKNETHEDFSYFSYEWLNEKTKIKPRKIGDKDSLESLKSFFERRNNENSRWCQQATSEEFAKPHIVLEKSCLGFVCEDVRFLADPQCRPFSNFMTSDG